MNAQPLEQMAHSTKMVVMRMSEAEEFEFAHASIGKKTQHWVFSRIAQLRSVTVHNAPAGPGSLRTMLSP